MTTEPQPQPQPQPQTGSVAALLSNWSSSQGAVALELKPAQPPEPSSAAAYLEADALVRSLGSLCVLHGSRAAPRQLVLAKSTAVDAGVLAVVLASATRLEVTARSNEDLALAAHLLRDPVLRARCLKSECLLGRAPRPAQLQPQAARAPTAATVLTLASSGHPGGWTVRGQAAQRLRLSWQRPPTWTIEHWPRLMLRIELSQDPDLELATSEVQIHLAERSLGRWSLTGGEAGAVSLSAWIPEELWNQSQWDFELMVTLRARRAMLADPRADSRLWLTVASESELSVPRKEPRFATSLAAFHESAERQQPTLIVQGPLSWSALTALAVAIAPWEGSRPWSVGRDPSGCGALCIVAQLAAHGTVPANGILLRSASAGRLEVLLGSNVGADGPIETPGYAALITKEAQWSGGHWVARGEPGRPSSILKVRPQAQTWALPAAALSSERVRRRLWIDLGWLFSVIAMIASAIFATQGGGARARRPQRSRP